MTDDLKVILKSSVEVFPWYPGLDCQLPLEEVLEPPLWLLGSYRGLCLAPGGLLASSKDFKSAFADPPEDPLGDHRCSFFVILGSLGAVFLLVFFFDPFGYSIFTVLRLILDYGDPSAGAVAIPVSAKKTPEVDMAGH